MIGPNDGSVVSWAGGYFQIPKGAKSGSIVLGFAKGLGQLSPDDFSLGVSEAGYCAISPTRQGVIIGGLMVSFELSLSYV